jgi:peroxiredoxin
MKHKFLLLILQVFMAGKVLCQIPAQTLPDFKFYKPDQGAFTEKDLPPAKMLFFVFFDSDCEHCQRAIKNIDQHYKSFKKVAIFLISMDDHNKIDHFMAFYGPHLKGLKNVMLLQDKLNQFIIKFKPYKYPSMFLYSAGKKLIDYEDNEETVFRFVNRISKTDR